MKKTITTLSFLALAATSQAAVTASSTLAVTDANLTPNALYTSVVHAWNANGTASATVGGVLYSTSQPTDIVIAEFPNAMSSSATAAHYTGGLATLMENGMNTDFNGAGGVITLNNLIVGRQYQLLMTSQHDIGNNPLRGHSLYFNPNGVSTQLHTGVNYGDDTGVVEEVYFTADLTSHTVKMFRPSGAQRATFNSILLVAVPEPSSAALLGLGGLALILRRRKG
ncbi:MAG: PEP-CTERM sorting domain-containing protein [Akkermansiaceae bacterium]|nr:PEP-CTERM sorting domain-containing protein [Akkermansiaceae bacterium]